MSKNSCDATRINTIIAMFIWANKSAGCDWRSYRRFFTVDEESLMDAMAEAVDLLRRYSPMDEND